MSVQSVRATRVAGACSGVTLIEMIVAMALTMVVGTVVVMMVFTGGKQANRAVGGQLVAQMARESFNLLSADVLAASSPDRRLYGDFDELADVLSTAPSAGEDVYDISIAEPRRLQLRADVHASPGTECVDYRDDAGAFNRIVTSGQADAWRSCQGQVLSKTRLFPAGAAPIFRYTLLVNGPGGTCERSERSEGVAAGSPLLNRIVQVNADLRSTNTRKDVKVDSNLVGSFSVNSRSTRVYSEALGCGG